MVGCAPCNLTGWVVASPSAGLVSNRDVDFFSNRATKLRDVMTTELVTAKEGVTLAEANDIMRINKKG